MSKIQKSLFSRCYHVSSNELLPNFKKNIYQTQRIKLERACLYLLFCFFRNLIGCIKEHLGTQLTLANKWMYVTCTQVKEHDQLSEDKYMVIWKPCVHSYYIVTRIRPWTDLLIVSSITNSVGVKFTWLE